LYYVSPFCVALMSMCYLTHALQPKETRSHLWTATTATTAASKVSAATHEEETV